MPQVTSEIKVLHSRVVVMSECWRRLVAYTIRTERKLTIHYSLWCNHYSGRNPKEIKIKPKQRLSAGEEIHGH